MTFIYLNRYLNKCQDIDFNKNLEFFVKKFTKVS